MKIKVTLHIFYCTSNAEKKILSGDVIDNNRAVFSSFYLLRLLLLSSTVREMFVLVLWSETQEFSVLPEEKVKIKEEGDCKAKWGRSWYPVKILQKSCELRRQHDLIWHNLSSIQIIILQT